MRRRGFTMIEIVIVIALISVMLLPILAMFVGMYRQMASAAQQADLRADADRAAYRIFRLAGGSYRIDDDNHGLRFGNGQHVRWDGGRLTLAGKPLLDQKVTEFNAVRDGKVLTLNLEVHAPARAGGQDVVWRYVYDYPRVGALR